MKTFLPYAIAGAMLCGCSSSTFNFERETRTLEYSYIFRNWNSDADKNLWVPREYYLDRLREAGVLKRGLQPSELERWLGKPDSISKTGEWNYDGGDSTLTVFFQDGKVCKYEQCFDEGPHLDKPNIW